MIMMKKYPYSYTILRYVHDTTSGEFVNIGIALYSREAGFLSVKIKPNHGRLSQMFGGMNVAHYKSVLSMIRCSFKELGEEVRDNSSVHYENVHALVHTIIAPEDCSFQWSKMGSGISKDLDSTAESIYERMVLRYENKSNNKSRDDHDVWKSFSKPLADMNVLGRLEEKTISSDDVDVKFSHSYQNGVLNCLEPVSLDYKTAGYIVEKANSMLGKVTSVANSKEKFRLHYLVGEPEGNKNKKQVETALNVLHKTPIEHEIIRESEAESFAAQVKAQLEEHDKKEANDA